MAPWLSLLPESSLSLSMVTKGGDLGRFEARERRGLGVVVDGGKRNEFVNALDRRLASESGSFFDPFRLAV